MILGSSPEASLGKLQSQPSTSTCSPSPVKMKKVRVSLEAERLGMVRGGNGGDSRDPIPRLASVSKWMKKRKEGNKKKRVEAGGYTCFLGELGYSGQHRRVPGLKEIYHEQGQSVVIEKGAAPCVNNQFQLD